MNESQIRTATASALLVAAYFHEHGWLPAQDGTRGGEANRPVALMYRLRLLKRRGQLPDDAEEILDKAHPDWADGQSLRIENRWQGRMEELIAWVSRHGRPPYWNAADRTERTLGAWVKRYLAYSRQGLHPDRIKTLDERLPTWRDVPASAPKAELDWMTR